MESVKLPHVVECPHCKYQHAAGEIFYPWNTIGQPSRVIRDALGKIIYIEYRDNQEPVAVEKYYCDNCGKAFAAEINISYKTHATIEEEDFSTVQTTLF